MSWKPLTVLAALAVPIATALPANAATTSSVHTATLTSSIVTTGKQDALSSQSQSVQTTPLSVTSSNVTNPLNGGKTSQTTPLSGTTQQNSAGLASTDKTQSKVSTSVPGGNKPTSTPSQSPGNSVPLSGPVTFYDSAQPSSIPSGVRVAGYSHGSWPWAPGDYNRFSGFKLTIDVQGGHTDSMVEDVEPGGATVGELHAWAVSRIQQGYTPVVYSAVSDYGAISQALAGIHWHWWAADPTGVPHLVPGSDATQYMWNGNSFDMSLSKTSLWDLVHT